MPPRNYFWGHRIPRRISTRWLSSPTNGSAELHPSRGIFSALPYHHMNVPVPSLRQKMPMLPPAVQQVILTALAKDPHQRYTSVQAFANALEAASQPPPMPLPPPTPVVQHVSPVPKNAPALATGVGYCKHCGWECNLSIRATVNFVGCHLLRTPEIVPVPQTTWHCPY